jgi:hypothetical protein
MDHRPSTEKKPLSTMDHGLSTKTHINHQYALDLQHHYDNQLTHDGQPKPRKDDIFKKIKNWWKGK